jgi:D-cysteine desulfhydrase
LAYFGNKKNLSVSAIHIPQKPLWDVQKILEFSSNYLKNLEFFSNTSLAYWEFFSKGWRGNPPPYLVYPQGISFLGCLSAIASGYELSLQLQDPRLPSFEALFIPSYSGIFAMGVAVGLKLGGITLPLHAVMVGKTKLFWFSRRTFKQTLATLRSLDSSLPGISPSQLTITWEKKFMGEGFGIPTLEAKTAKAIMDLSEGVHLELTYTAKCLSAVMDYHRTHPHHGPILFWNTAPPIPPDSLLKSFEGLPEEYREYFRKSARIPQDS